MTRFISKSARRSRFAVAGAQLDRTGGARRDADPRGQQRRVFTHDRRARNRRQLRDSWPTPRSPTSRRPRSRATSGVSPLTSNGLTCAEVTGTIYSVDASGPLPCRVTDPGLLTTATETTYDGLQRCRRADPDPTLVGGDNQLGGQTLVAGVYRFGAAPTANLSGTLTLSGSASDVWIFQATLRPRLRQPAQRGPHRRCIGLQRLLAGQQLRDAQLGLEHQRNGSRLGEHHRRDRRHDQRPPAGSNR